MKKLTLITALLAANVASAQINFDTQKMSYTPPAKLVHLCKTVIQNRITQAKQADEYTDDMKDASPKTACMDVDIDLVKTNLPWVDDVLNEFFVQPQLRTELDETSDWVYDYFVEDGSSTLTYQLSSEAKLVGVSDKTVQISRTDYEFTFGPHGMPSVEFFVMDLAHKQRLTLDDVLVSGDKKDELREKLKQKFIKELKSKMEMMDDEVQAHFELWEFDVNDNFYFSPNGMTFVYIPYGIGPYAMGFTSLSATKSELKGLIKDKYLTQKFSQFDDDDWSESSQIE